MVSEIANRENAKLGGVKTEAGKQVSRMNAVTHGLLIKVVFSPGEKTTLINQLRDNITTELAPQGELETIMAKCIVSSLWRLKRVLKVESDLIGDDNKNLANANWVIAWQNLGRYETMIERQMYKAIHDWKECKGRIVERASRYHWPST